MNIGDLVEMADYILDTPSKRHIVGGVLLSASLLFGGLALTVMTLNGGEDTRNKIRSFNESNL